MTDSQQAKQKQTLFWTVAILVVVVVGFFSAIIYQVVNAKPDLAAVMEENHGVLFKAPREVPAVELIDHEGQAFTTARFEGHWNLVNFGYTFCPDICPTNLADMNMAYKQLQTDGVADQVNFWMVSVDPARDTVEQLSNYVPYFNPAFIGLTGDMADITTLATQLAAVFYQEGEGEGYTVAHSDNYALINPQGEFVALLRPPHKPSHIAAALEALIQSK